MFDSSRLIGYTEESPQGFRKNGNNCSLVKIRLEDLENNSLTWEKL
jgi:hypothetical protein